MSGARSSSKSSSSSTPWASSESSSESARSQRQNQLMRLLQALERKKHSDNNGTTETSTAGEEQDQKEKRRSSTAAHSGGVRVAATSRVGDSAGSRQPSASSRTRAPSASRAASARAATLSHAHTTLPPPPDEHDAASQAYKSQLLESRGRRSAAAQAAAGAAAIEKGASVHTRSDVHDAIHASPSSTPISSSHATSSLPSSSPSGFAVAAGGSMEERAAIRALRRQQIAEQHAAAEAARQVEIEARERAEMDAIEEVKRAEAARRREARRLEREAAAAKTRAAELESQKALLASLHHQRARLLYFGWGPWRRLLEAAHIRGRAMDRHASINAAKRFWRRWLAGIEVNRAQRAELDARKMEKAARHFRRRRLRQLMRRWFRAVARRDQDIAAKRAYHRRIMIRNAFRALRRGCFLVAQARERKLQRLEPRVVALASRVVRSHAFTVWRRAVAVTRATKAAAKKQQAVKEKVGGWLEEFRAQKARERGELPADVNATAPIATAFAALRLDPSDRTDSAAISSPPGYTFSSSSSTFTPAAASTATAATTSPSRYSALVTSPRSPLPLSPSSYFSSAPSAATSATADPHTSPYAEFITSLSPRAMVHATAFAASLPSRDSTRQSVDPLRSERSLISSPRAANSPFGSPRQSSTDLRTSSAKGPRAEVAPSASAATSKRPLDAAPSTTKRRPASAVNGSAPPSVGDAPSAAASRSTRAPKLHSKHASLSGTNLPPTGVAVPLRKVAFEMGAGLQPVETAPVPRSSSRPASALPASRSSSGANSSPSTSTIAPSSNFSLIQSAKANVLEMDRLEALGTNGINGAATDASHLFHIASTHPDRHVPSGINYDTSVDEESGDAFDRHMDMVLTKSYRPPSNHSRPSSSARPRVRAEDEDAVRSAPLDSDRSDLTASSHASDRHRNNDTGAASGTWSSQHAHVPVSLAEARAMRREQAARKAP